jgi:hypothetical protein
VAVEHARRRRENAWLAEIAALTRDQRQLRMPAPFALRADSASLWRNPSVLIL